MLKSQLDLDRAFDAIIKRSFPYLVFPPQEFRNALAEQLDSLCQYHREGNYIAFPDRAAATLKMMDDAAFDDLTDLKIHYFEYRQESIDQCLRKIDERLSKIERRGKLKTDVTVPYDISTPVQNVRDTLQQQEPVQEKEIRGRIEEVNRNNRPIREGIEKGSKSKYQHEIILERFRHAGAGKKVTLNELVEQTGLSSEQISRSIYHLKNRWGARIDSVDGATTADVRKDGSPAKVPAYIWGGESESEQSSIRKEHENIQKNEYIHLPEVKPVKEGKYTEIIRDYLKSVGQPQSAEEISQNVGLTVAQVKQAARGADNTKYIKITTLKKIITNTIGVTKGYRVARYEYCEDKNQ